MAAHVVQRVDEWLLRRVNTAPTPLGDRGWRWWRQAELAAIPVAAGVAWAAGRPRLGLRVLLAGGLAEAGGKAAKQVWQRDRPTDVTPRVVERGGDFDGPAMPSDHVAIAAALHAVAAPSVGRGAWALGTVLVAAAGIERIHVGAHRPLDVIVGAALGHLVGRIVRRAPHLRLPAPAA